MEQSEYVAGAAAGNVQAIVNSRECLYCKTIKPWIYSGQKLKDGSKIYLDAGGSRWAGRRCPDCERGRVQIAVKCDHFRRELVIKELQKSGYTILSKTLPILVEKEGKQFSVGIRYAITDDGQIIFEKNERDGADIYAVIFESVRIWDQQRMEELEPHVRYFKGDTGVS